MKPYAGPPIRVVALSPGAGILQEAVGVELFNRDFTIVESSETAEIAGRFQLSEFEVSGSVGLAALREKNIDALLIVKSASGTDGRPQSATAKLISTRTSEVISTVSWQNGWGGQEGSILDRSKRKDVNGAAKEIAAALVRNLSR
jgi:hypothetical protein